MSTEGNDSMTKMLEQYQSIIDKLLSCNKKQTVEYFLENLELD
jgi:hypothetical protein